MTDQGPEAQPVLVLASGSPRRRELLATLGIPFEVRPADVDETPLPGERPDDLVRRLAVAKAEAALGASGDDDAVVIGADTTVSLGDRLLGKPGDEAEARQMLRDLSGTRHCVLTGVALAARWSDPEQRGDGGEGATTLAPARTVEVEVVETWVEFRTLTDAQIDGYVATGEPFDKAGGYGIQDQHDEFVRSIDGPFDNVVGLPVDAVRRLLAAVGIDVPDPPPSTPDP